MNIPVFQSNKLTDEKGNLTNEQQMWFDNLIQTLQNGVGPFGFTVTNAKTAEIAGFIANGNAPLGTTWYNVETNKLQVLTNTGVQTITSS